MNLKFSTVIAVTALALPVLAQNRPPSHYLKVYWLAKDNSVNFMVVDDDEEDSFKVYMCEMHGRTIYNCAVPHDTYVVIDSSQAEVPQKPAKARTIYYVAHDNTYYVAKDGSPDNVATNIAEASSVRDLAIHESVLHALNNPFGREDR